MVKLVFGCGYLGHRVARRWLAQGHTVYAVTRSPDRARKLAAEGLLPIVADLTDGSSPRLLPAAETVLFAVGYDRAAGHSIRDVYVQGLQRTLDGLPAPTQRMIYISSTGVFGQTDGRWVDEASACQPAREGGRACWEAERRLADHPLGQRAIVLRLAGLYGPGRIPRRADLEQGKPIAAPSEGYLNLIHVEDAVEVVLRAESLAVPPRLYLVSDAQPPTRRQYFEELARLLGAPAPRFETPRADAPARLRIATHKRISNRRMMQELNVALRYPSYREGLAAIVASEPRQGQPRS